MVMMHEFGQGNQSIKTTEKAASLVRVASAAGAGGLEIWWKARGGGGPSLHRTGRSAAIDNLHGRGMKPASLNMDQTTEQPT